MKKYNDCGSRMPGIKRYFSVQRFCFARIGIDVTSLERTVISYCQFWFLTVALALLSCLILLYVIKNVQNLDKATESLIPLCQILIAIFKVIYFKYNSSNIIKIVQKLWLWNLEAQDAEHAILLAENHKDIIFCNFYHFAVASTAFIALLAPFIKAGFYAWHGENFLQHLEAPAKAEYFIDIKSVSGFIVAYIWNILGIYLLVYGSVSVDSLFSYFMCNIVAHFRILKYRLRLAGAENNGNSSLKAIRDFIVYHCRTLHLAKEFNDAFSMIIFIKFAISCIQVCCLVFQLSRGGAVSDVVFQGLFLISVSAQLILYCYGGQRIQTESASLANEIYNSFHWELLTVHNKKMLTFAMKRSQLACNVSGIFFTANLSLFLWVYRTAASFITLLGTLEEKEIESY